MKRSDVDITNYSNFQLVSNLPFLVNFIDSVVALQFQQFLDDIDYLNPIQYGFGTEIALVTLVDDLRSNLDRGSVYFLVFLDLATVLDTINHDTLLFDFGLVGTVWTGSVHSCQTGPRGLCCGTVA